MATQKKSNIDFENDQALKEIISRLVNKLHPKKIILFGSRATGSSVEGSDYDIAIVLPSKGEDKAGLMDMAYQALWGVKTSVDVVILDPEELNKDSEVVNTIPFWVQEEGVQIYHSFAKTPSFRAGM